MRNNINSNSHLKKCDRFFDNFIWLNTNEAAEYLRTTPKQIRNWVYQGKIKFYKLFDRRLRFKKTDLDLLLKGGF